MVGKTAQRHRDACRDIVATIDLSEHLRFGMAIYNVTLIEEECRGLLGEPKYVQKR